MTWKRVLVLAVLWVVLVGSVGTVAATAVTAGGSAGVTAELASAGADDRAGGVARPLAGADGWQTNTSANGTAAVVSGGLSDAKLDFSVYKCNYAFANRSLGDVNGTLDVSFDWRTYSDGYWEATKVIVRVDGEERFLQNQSDVSINHSVGETETGRVDATVQVDGDVTVAVGIIPTQYCTNGDHADSEFTVSNLDIDVNGATPTAGGDATPTPTPGDNTTGDGETTPIPGDGTAADGADTTTGQLRGDSDEEVTVQVNATAGNVSLDRVGVSGDERFDGRVTVTASRDPLATSPAYDISPAHEALAYFSVETTIDPGAVERVTLRVRVSGAAVERAGGPREIALYRYNETKGRWVAQPTTIVGFEGDVLVYEVTADGFSEWVAGTERPEIDIAEATVDLGASGGTDEERAQVSARITNGGEADGVYVTKLLLDGDVVDRRRVTVPTGGTVQVSFERNFDAAGVYTVAVNNVTAGAVTVAGNGSLTVRGAGAVVTGRTTASGSGPLLSPSMGALLGAALVACWSLARRQ